VEAAHVAGVRAVPEDAGIVFTCPRPWARRSVSGTPYSRPGAVCYSTC
jgi:hypothetical protein